MDEREQIRSEQLDRAVEAMLAGHEPDAETQALASLAGELRGAPSEEFKAILKAKLERQTATAAPAAPAPAEFPTITAYLMMERITHLADFVRQAFGATESVRVIGSAGGLHITAHVGDAMLMLGGGIPMPERPAAFHLYVEDADAVYRRALEAGATTLYEPTDQPYGDREAGVRDPFGNFWYIATHRGPRHVPEGMRSLTPVLHPVGTERLMTFLEQALGAEQVAVHRSPEGAVMHAQVRIGDSLLELGEAHGMFPPMSAALYLCVEDADAAYRRAVAAGATTLWEPKDQPYGHRTAGVADPWGNQWFLAASRGA